MSLFSKMPSPLGERRIAIRMEHFVTTEPRGWRVALAPRPSGSESLTGKSFERDGYSCTYPDERGEIEASQLLSPGREAPDVTVAEGIPQIL